MRYKVILVCLAASLTVLGCSSGPTSQNDVSAAADTLNKSAAGSPKADLSGVAAGPPGPHKH